MRFEDPHVPIIGLEPEIEDTSGKWDHIDQIFKENIQGHSDQRGGSCPKIGGRHQNGKRKQCGDNIPDKGHEAQDTIQTKSDTERAFKF